MKRLLLTLLLFAAFLPAPARGASDAEATMIRILDGIYQKLNGGIAATTTPSTAQRTPTITTVSASGTVSAGSRKLTFIFSSDFAGTVLGATFSGASDVSVTLDAPAGDTLAAVAYTRSAGSIRIVDVR